MDPADVTAAYNRLRPSLEQMCSGLKQWVEEVAAKIGIEHPRIDGRVKDLDSLLLKAHRKEVQGEPWTDPVTDASDKVGIRIDVVYDQDVSDLAAAIAGSLGQFEADPVVDDKRALALGADRLGYQGVHIEVVPRERPQDVPIEAARCEIQVRTNAQSAWAMASHDLTYKGGVQDDWLERRVNRLTALLELVDEGLDQARNEIVNGQAYPLARLVHALTRARVQFTTRASDRELTHGVVTRLVQDPAEAVELVERLERFVEVRATRLGEVLTREGDPIVHQPESILIFMFLDEDPFTAQRRWYDADLPVRVLETLAVEWGAEFTTPL